MLRIDIHLFQSHRTGLRSDQRNVFMFVIDKQLVKSYFSAGGLQHGPFLWISLQFSLIVYTLSVKWGKSVSKVDVSVPRDRKHQNMCIKALMFML